MKRSPKYKLNYKMCHAIFFESPLEAYTFLNRDGGITDGKGENMGRDEEGGNYWYAK